MCGDEKDLVNGEPTGSVRVSFGYMTMQRDVDKLINVLTSYFVQGCPVRKLPEWWPGFQKAYAQKYQSVLGNCNGPISVDNIKTPAILDVRQTFKMPSPLNTMSRGTLDRNSITLTDIYVYPVKSCGAMRMESWVIGSRGFLYDRKWMVVTPAGVCLTQKQDTKLCLIQPSIDLSRRLLILQFPGKSHSVPVTYVTHIQWSGNNFTRNSVLFKGATFCICLEVLREVIGSDIGAG